MTPTHVAYQRYNPCRTPDWRWRRACRLVDDNRRLLPRRDDAQTIEAARYLRDSRRCRTERQADRMADARHDVHAALQIHEVGGPRRLEIQARLLARQTPEEVAERVSLPVSVI